MQFTITESGDSTEVNLSGELAFSDHEDFRAMVKDATGRSGKTCVMNLGGLDTIDSAGLGMLMIIRDEAESKGKDVVLRGAKGMVRKMLDIADLGAVFTIED